MLLFWQVCYFGLILYLRVPERGPGLGFPHFTNTFLAVVNRLYIYLFLPGVLIIVDKNITSYVTATTSTGKIHFII